MNGHQLCEDSDVKLLAKEAAAVSLATPLALCTAQLATVAGLAFCILCGDVGDHSTKAFRLFNRPVVLRTGGYSSCGLISGHPPPKLAILQTLQAFQCSSSAFSVLAGSCVNTVQSKAAETDRPFQQGSEG